MVWIDNISELEFYSPNPIFGCYGDPIYTPNDILLQARYPKALDFSNVIMYEINVLKPDGTLIESLPTANPYFDIFNGLYTISGTTYNYTNIRCNSYSTGMLSNVCFILQFILTDSAGTLYFNMYTQKYILNNTAVPVSGATISGDSSEIALCGSEVAANDCNVPVVKFVAIFDCIDTFTGDYYGDPTTLLGGAHGLTPFPFVKLSNIIGRLRPLPSQIKRTISINNRTQKTETTPKLQLDAIVPFPVWKMLEIEGMLLANHLFVDGTEYQADSSTPFAQIGKLPQGCSYVYKFNLPMMNPYAWQVFGCTSVCASQSYYYLIPF